MSKDLMSMLDPLVQDLKCHQSVQFSQSKEVKLDQRLQVRKAFSQLHQKQEPLLKTKLGKLDRLKIKKLL